MVWWLNGRLLSCSPGFESGISPAHSWLPISWWVATWDCTWLRADLCEGRQRRKLRKHQKTYKEKKKVCQDHLAMVLYTRTLYTLSSWWETLVHYPIGQDSISIFLLVRISDLSSNWSGWTWWRVRSCSRVWPFSPPASATPLGPTSSDLSATGWAGQLPPPRPPAIQTAEHMPHLVNCHICLCLLLELEERGAPVLWSFFTITFLWHGNWRHCQQKLIIS